MLDSEQPLKSKGLLSDLRRISLRLLGACSVAVLILAAAGCGGSSSVANFRQNPSSFPSPKTPLDQLLSTDVFSNASSQHATEVEPSAFAFGSTIVAAFQSGRFVNAGSSDIAFATSHDGGVSWVDGVLPDTTDIVMAGSPFNSISDPSVAYDAAHAVWLISSLPVIFSGAPAPAVLVSRSNDGLSWTVPVSVAPGVISSDKDWIACDDSPGSPYYGRCYVEWDDPSANGLVHMSTSIDGGQTWSAPASSANLQTGIGGQPVVQANGTVVVPVDDFFEQNVYAFVSHDGGASWNASVLVAPIVDHLDAAGLRSGPLPSAAVDAAGTVYLAWQDCRFRSSCAANDIVFSTSANGVSWSVPVRVPIDTLTSGVDHFLPGIRVAPATSGPSAYVGITYFYYANTACTVGTCLLDVGFISSTDGGSTWNQPAFLAGPMNVGWLAQTSIGLMVGDYTTTVFSNGQPFGIFAVAREPKGMLNEAMYVTRPGTIAAVRRARLTSFGERAIPGVHSDHPPRLPPPPRQMRALGDPFGGD